MSTTYSNVLRGFWPEADDAMKDLPVSPVLASVAASLRDGSGAPPETAALFVLAVLGGLAGVPQPAVGESPLRVRPGWSPCFIGTSPAASGALSELVMAPVRRMARSMRERSRHADTGFLAQWVAAKERATGMHLPDDPWSALEGRMIRRSAPGFRVAVSTRPFFYLQDPGLGELRQGLRASFDQCLLVDCTGGNRLEKPKEGTGGAHSHWIVLMHRLLRGAHVGIEENGPSPNPIGLDQPVVSAVFVIDGGNSSLVFGSRSTAVQRLLRELIFLPAGPSHRTGLGVGTGKCGPGLDLWEKAVTAIVHERRRAKVWWMRTPAAQDLGIFGRYRADLLGLERSMPSILRPHMAPLMHLPVRLLGAVEKISSLDPASQRARDPQSDVEVAEGLARIAVRGHVGILLDELGRRGLAPVPLSSPEQTMLAKISARGPLRFRELTRCYSRQSRSEHLPVFNRLRESGAVVIGGDGLIQAVEAGGEAETG